MTHRALFENAMWVTTALLGSVPGLAHGFSLRAAGDFARERAERSLLERAGAQRLRLLRQVHGARVARPDDPAPRPEADGWAGESTPGEFLGILTADCLPVLLCHPPSRILGLAHAGWRGVVRGIVTETLKAMEVPAEEVKVALGPSIGPCCYQVGEDVARAVGHGSPHVSAWERQAGKYRLDLGGLVRYQLAAAGVFAENVESLSVCTACRSDLFFSHRREGRTGRMISVLGWVGVR
jgi:YfiH family protein